MIVENKILKCIFRCLFLVNIWLIFCLTFQSQENTTLVSEHVRDIAAQTVSASSEDVSSSWWYNLRNFRQLAHLPEYFALGCTATLALMTVHIKRHRYLYSFICCMGVSCVDQIIKWFLPTREFNFLDMIFDFIGYTIGIIIVFCLTRLLVKLKT